VLTPAIDADALPRALTEYADIQDLELATFAGPEAQVAALADDIAYNNHDIDDGLRAGLFSIDDLMALPHVGQAFRSTLDEFPGLEETRVIHESVRRLIGSMIGDVIAETRARLESAKPQCAADVRAMSHAVVSFSDEMQQHNATLKEFLFRRMYRHYRVNRSMSKARRIVTELFALLHAEPELLPPEWLVGCDGAEGVKTARRVCDFIAGMTDKFAIEEHKRLFDLSDPRA